MRAHIFNISTLVNLEQSCWIVDKTNPNIPILKISQSDFKLIKSGIYKSQGHKVEFNGNTYWLPTELMNKIKVKLKLTRSSLENVGISMQEFLNKNIVDDMKLNFTIENIIHLKNSNDDIYVICSKQTERIYDKVINKLEDRLAEDGIRINKFYYLSETFYNQSDDDIKYKKMKLLVQHLCGYKTQMDKFIDEEVKQYNTISYYDTSYDTLKMTDETNIVFKMILDKTEDGLKSVIKEDLIQNRPALIVNQISTNSVNNMSTKKINLEYVKIIKTFESHSINEALLNYIKADYIENWDISMEDLEDYFYELSDMSRNGLKTSTPSNPLYDAGEYGTRKPIRQVIILGYVRTTKEIFESTVSTIRKRLLSHDIILMDGTMSHSKTKPENNLWFCCFRLMNKIDFDYYKVKHSHLLANDRYEY